MKAVLKFVRLTPAIWLAATCSIVTPAVVAALLALFANDRTKMSLPATFRTDSWRIDVRRQCGVIDVQYRNLDAATEQSDQSAEAARHYLTILDWSNRKQASAATARVLVTGWPFPCMYSIQEVAQLELDGAIISGFEAWSGAVRRGIVLDIGEQTAILPTKPLLVPYAANVVVTLVTLVAIIVAGRLLRSKVLERAGRCPTCKYDLSGNLGGGCPECGWGREA